MKLIITGVGKGFGRSYLEHLTDDNKYEIVGLTRTISDFTANELKLFSKKHVKIQEVNLCSQKEVYDFIDKNIDFLNQTDVLINNAGQRYRRKIDDLSWTDLSELFSVNVITPMILSSAVAAGMRSRKFGKIVNISSILGVSGMKDLSGYAATKGAIDSVTRSMAIELAPFNINVNAIAPGFCETSYFSKFKQDSSLFLDVTQRIPMGHWGKSQTINGSLDYLISNEAKYVTGQILYVDGGWTAQ